MSPTTIIACFACTLAGLVLLWAIPALARRATGELRVQLLELMAASARRGLPLRPLFAKASVECPGWRRLGQVSARLDEGACLADALAASPKVFPARVVAVVRAADGRGELESALRALAVDDDRAGALRARAASQLGYPLLVGLSLLVLQSALAGYWERMIDVPEFAAGIDLRVIVVILLAVLGCGVLFATGRLSFLLPSSGTALSATATVLRSGAGLPEALRAGGACEPRRAADFAVAAAALEQGESLPAALSRTGLRPAIVTRISAAATLGPQRFVTACAAAGRDTARRAQLRGERLLTLIERAAVVAIGVVLALEAIRWFEGWTAMQRTVGLW